MSRHFAIVHTDQGPAAGALRERTPRRARVLLADGQEVTLPGGRVLLAWEEPGTPPASGAEAHTQVAELARDLREPPPSFDPEALYAALPHGEALPFAQIAARALGESADGRLRARLFWALLGTQEHFRRSRKAFVARSTAERRQHARREAALRDHHAWLDRVAGWIAMLEEGSPLPEGDGEAREFVEQLRSLAAFEGRSPHWKALMRPLGLQGHNWPANRVKLKRWLEAAGAWPGWAAVWLEGAGVAPGFPPEVAAAAEALAATPVAAEGRMDRRGPPAYSLDSTNTQDVDDACAILDRQGETLEIAVHIADPAAFLAPGDPVFEEALRRAASVYTEDGIFPMLPERLSTDRFSLNAGEAREALSFRLRVAPGGAELLAIEPSIVNLTDNLDYDRGAVLLEQADNEWHRLARLCDGLAAARAQAGARMVERPEIVVDHRDPGHIRLTRIDRHDPIHRLVEELAILVNGEAGRYCARHGLPAFYRVQPKDNNGDAAQVPAARFSLAGAPHKGLAVERYVQVTSPIRRITDLVMVRQLATHVVTGVPAFPDPAVLERWMKLAEKRFTVYHQLERRIEDHWKRRYLAQNPGFEVTGIVRRDGRAARSRIWLEDLLMDAEARLPADMGLRSRGRFRVAEVDLDRQHVEVELLERL